MRRPAAAALPALLGAGWLLALFAPLLSPELALANRDIHIFHLPLRTAFRWLAEIGPPVWNPWLHSGQPILSNPNYAAFYPPSWIVLAVEPSYALNLLVVFHAAVAFAGAWRLARRLGGGPGAAALAAVGYVGSGAFLPLVHAFNFLCGMAWLPWGLLLAHDLLQRDRGWRDPRGWVKPGVLLGLVLALELFCGEPVTVLVNGLALLALAIPAAVRRPAVLARLAVPALAALLFAAVQLVPTLGRLADSPRQSGLEQREATAWSSPPERVIELFFPRFYGDPARQPEGLFFGWKFHDRDFPYVASLYPGLLLAVLGLSALGRWPVPRRAGWALAFAAGAFLALGRHNPLYEAVREALPVLAVIRFPEKFAVLSVAALLMAGVLGWQWLLDERDAGRRDRADLPLAFAGVLLATAAGLTALLYAMPRLAFWYVQNHGAPGLSPRGQAAAVAYLRGEGWKAVIAAAAVVLLLALCRSRRPPRRFLEAAAVALLAADLLYYGQGMVSVMPASVYREPPPLAAALLPPRDRIYLQPVTADEPEMVPLVGDSRTLTARAGLARLEPYAAILWGIPYGLHEDFDLMMTGWAGRAIAAVRAERDDPQRSFRLLGAWNVGHVLMRRPRGEWARDALSDPDTIPVRVVVNPYVLRRYRFVPRVTFHADQPGALAAARAEGYELKLSEHWVDPRAAGRTVTRTVAPVLLSIRDEGGRIEIHYDSEQPALFVAAVTFDEGWRATVDGAPAAVRPTALSQMGVELPAGKHRLVLVYRDPLVAIGAAVTLGALGAALFAGLWARRRARAAPAPALATP
jgi:hypothetical protein